MPLYHGSPVAGIEMLRPQVSTHGKAYTYLTSDPMVAALYAARILEPPYAWCPYGFVGGNGELFYSEYYEGAFSEVYDGKKGYLYTCEAPKESLNPTNIHCALVTEAPVRTVSCEELPDVGAWLRAHGLRIDRFADMCEKTAVWSHRTMVEEIQKGDLLQKENDPYAAFIRARFPLAWAAAQQK